MPPSPPLSRAQLQNQTTAAIADKIKKEDDTQNTDRLLNEAAPTYKARLIDLYLLLKTPGPARDARLAAAATAAAAAAAAANAQKQRERDAAQAAIEAAKEAGKQRLAADADRAKQARATALAADAERAKAAAADAAHAAALQQQLVHFKQHITMANRSAFLFALAKIIMENTPTPFNPPGYDTPFSTALFQRLGTIDHRFNPPINRGRAQEKQNYLYRVLEDLRLQGLPLRVSVLTNPVAPLNGGEQLINDILVSVAATRLAAAPTPQQELLAILNPAPYPDLVIGVEQSAQNNDMRYIKLYINGEDLGHLSVGKYGDYYTSLQRRGRTVPAIHTGTAYWRNIHFTDPRPVGRGANGRPLYSHNYFIVHERNPTGIYEGGGSRRASRRRTRTRKHKSRRA